jgi:hypothetical protein
MEPIVGCQRDDLHPAYANALLSLYAGPADHPISDASLRFGGHSPLQWFNADLGGGGEINL